MLAPFSFWEPARRRTVRRQGPLRSRLPTLGACAQARPHSVVDLCRHGFAAREAMKRRPVDSGPRGSGPLSVH